MLYLGKDNGGNNGQILLAVGDGANTIRNIAPTALQ
jgi:hypothetical protein